MRHLLLLLLILFSYSSYAVSVLYPPATIDILRHNTEGSATPEGSTYNPPDHTSAKYMMDMYEKTSETNEALNGVARAYGQVADNVIDSIDFGGTVISAAHGNFMGVFATKMFATTAHAGVNYLVNGLESQGNAQASYFLLGALKDTYKRVPNLAQLTPKQQYDEFIKTEAFKSKHMSEFLKDHKDNAIFQTFMLDSIESHLVQSGIKGTKDQNENKKFMEDLAKQNLKLAELENQNKEDIVKEVEKIGQTIIATENKRYEDQKQLLDAQKAMLNSISELTKSAVPMVAHIDTNVTTVKEMMFTTLSIDEQKRRLDSGEMDENFTLVQKEGLQNRLNVQIAMVNITQTANAVTTIASTIGVDPKIINTVSKGVAAVQAGATLALSIMTPPNPLGILSGVAGIVGLFGKQTDPASERHNQIMESFSKLSQQIADGNKEIRDDIAKMHNDIKTIDKNIRIINDKVDAVMVALSEMNQRITNIDLNVVMLSELILEDMYQDYGLCSKLLKNIRSAESYDQLQLILNPIGQPRFISNRINQCVHAFDLLFAVDNQSAFFRSVLSTDELNSDSYKANYLRIVNLLGNDLVQSDLNKLVLPNDKIMSLRTKEKTETETEREIQRVKFNWNAMMNPVDVNKVYRVVTDYLTFYPISYMFSQDCSSGVCIFIPKEQLKNPSIEFPGSTMSGLQEALALTQIAIAQQTAVGGDTLLYKVVDKLVSKTASKEYLSILEDIMYYNPIFAKNLMLLYVKNYILTKNPHKLWYKIALGCPSSPVFLEKLELPFKFSWENKHGRDQVYFLVASKNSTKSKTVYLPTVKELKTGDLQTSPELFMLLNLRRKVVTAIVDLKMVEQISSSHNVQLIKTYVDLL